jgi:iron complex outermembrane recepter protein
MINLKKHISKTTTMKKLLLIVLTTLTSHWLMAQVYEVTGVIKDATSNETIIGATVLYADGKGTQTDINGNFKLKLANGVYTLKTSFVGYETTSKKIAINGASINVNFSLPLKNNLKEVEITADIAKNRETPVAFSTIGAKQIQQELAGRDLPNLLNSTPGVYATEGGGGNGDSRINVRGFDQRNVGMLLDGVPFNDMENGAVYWSNWSGLGGAVQTMQVQRGLGASKLALPSVGGTINVITKGITDKRGGRITLTQANNDNITLGASFNSGIIGKGFGYTASFNYQQGNGFVDKTASQGVAYFLKLQRRFNRHLLSFSLNGVNQKHEQRFTKTSMAAIDTNYALKHGFSQGLLDTIRSINEFTLNKGLTFNPDWGYLVKSPGDTAKLSGQVNYYTKPVFTLNDYWTFRENMAWINVAYLSIGTGGGAFVPSTAPSNASSKAQLNFTNPSYDNSVSTNLTQAGSFSRSSVNNHFWYGALSTLNIDVNEKLKWQMGIDLRSYNGTHYQTPRDMFGADYVIDNSTGKNKNTATGNNNSTIGIIRVGDKMGYNYTSAIRWAGAFSQLEYKNEKVSMFLNVTNSYSFYQRTDQFAKRDLVLSDTTALLAVGFGDTLVRKGTKYTINSPEARVAKTEWKRYINYSFKGGMNFNINEHNNVFMNLGYLVLPPRYVNVFDRNNRVFSDVKNQFVKSIELGYGLKFKKFGANVNAYYTLWANKPPEGTSSKQSTDANGNPTVVFFNINGIDARHAGIEFDFNYKPLKKVTIDGVISLADWIYTSNKSFTVVDQDGTPLLDAKGVQLPEENFNAKGVHVGNAAQNQFVLSANYEPIKNLNVKLRGTYFGKNYSNFDPSTLKGANSNRESWKIPNYYTFDFFTGYKFLLPKNHSLDLGFGIINLLNERYVADAQNNGASGVSYFNTAVGERFNASSATVYFAQGRRWNVNVAFNF